MQHKLLEDLESAIEQGEEFSISTRRRESVLDGSAVARDAIYELKFRSPSGAVQATPPAKCSHFKLFKDLQH